MNIKKRLLCIVYELGNFEPMRMVAEAGNDSGAFDCIFWSPYALPESERFKAEALAAGCIYVEETTPLGALGDIMTPLSSWLTTRPLRLPVSTLSTSGFGGPSSVEFVLSALDGDQREAVLRAVDIADRRVNFCEDWLVRLGIDTVLFSEDNVERDSYAWIAAARRRNVQTVISSYGALSTTEFEQAYAASPAHQVAEPLLGLFRKHLPYWLRHGETYAITRLPWVEALGREYAGYRPFNPWLINSGGANYIALESKAMVNSYLQCGFPSTGLTPIGHPLQDYLAKARANRDARRLDIASRHGFSPDEPLIIVAMPPNQTMTRSSLFPNYEALCRSFIENVQNITNAVILVSPHPNITPMEKDMLRGMGARIEEGPVADILPLADLYITCVSSTIKWALGLGVPVIDFDCYGYGYEDYLDLEQVLSVDSEAGFRAGLKRWANKEERQSIILSARNGVADWGPIDGKAMQRLIRLCIDEEAHHCE